MKLFQLGAVLAAATLYSSSALAQDSRGPGPWALKASATEPKAPKHKPRSFVQILNTLLDQHKLIDEAIAASAVVENPSVVGRYMYIDGLMLNIKQSSPHGFETVVVDDDQDLGKFILIYPFPVKPQHVAICDTEGCETVRPFSLIVQITGFRTAAATTINSNTREKIPVYRVVVAVDLLTEKTYRTPEFD